MGRGRHRWLTGTSHSHAFQELSSSGRTDRNSYLYASVSFVKSSPWSSATEHTASQAQVNLRFCHCEAGPNCPQVTPKVTPRSQRRGPVPRRPCAWRATPPRSDGGPRVPLPRPCLPGSRPPPTCRPRSCGLRTAGLPGLGPHRLRGWGAAGPHSPGEVCGHQKGRPGEHRRERG